MSVVVQTPYNAHIANGVSTTFGFTFQLLLATDLQVSFDGVPQAPSVYSISGLGVEAGGSINVTAGPPAVNTLVEIERIIPLARSTDYQYNGDLPEEQLDRDFDRLWQALQDAAFRAGLTISLPPEDTAAPMVLPSVTDRASKFFAFNALGEAIAALGVPDVPATAFAATLLDDPDAATARATLGAAASGAISASGLTIATARMLGRTTAGVGAPEELTSTQVTATFVDAASTAAAGKVELTTNAEAQTGTDTSRAITAANLKAAQIQLGTVVASTSGTAIDFTGIPSWAKRITVMFNNVSTNGTSVPLVQLGDSGGVETTGYVGAVASVQNAGATGVSNRTDGFGVVQATVAAVVCMGSVTLSLMDAATNTWVATGIVARSDAPVINHVAGTKSLSATLDRVRVVTANGTDTFDAGSINISWE